MTITVGIELEGQLTSLLLDEYQEVVKKLITVIDELMKDDTSQGIAWDDAKIVAELQLHVCEIVEHMIGHEDIIHPGIQNTIGSKETTKDNRDFEKNTRDMHPHVLLVSQSQCLGSIGGKIE